MHVLGLQLANRHQIDARMELGSSLLPRASALKIRRVLREYMAPPQSLESSFSASLSGRCAFDAPLGYDPSLAIAPHAPSPQHPFSRSPL